MKKIFLIFLLITLLIKNNTAQTYRQLFDKKNYDDFKTGYYSLHSNINSQLALYNSDVMLSYLTMYKATKDLKYLHEFVIHAKRVIDRRDDHISSASPVADFPNGTHPIGACNVAQVPISFLSTGYPGWSRLEIVQSNNLCQLIPFPHSMETGGVLYPLASFVLLTMEDPSFASVSLPTEATFASVSTFGDFASWLKQQIYASLDWQIWEDYNRVAFSCNGCDAFVSQFSAGWQAINLQAAMGRPLVVMYRVAVLDGNYHQSNYYPIIDKMALKFKNLIQSTPSNPPFVGETNNLPWNTWCHAANCSGNLWEDIAHAHIEEVFAELCYKYFPVNHFGLSDMQKFANGLAYRMVPEPLKFTMNVYGTNNDCDQMCGSNPETRYNQCGVYSFLSQYNKQIYQEISDFYVPDNVNFFSGAHPLISLQAYANLALNEHLFNPISAKGNLNRSGVLPNQSSTVWVNATSGDFNNDGSDELASINSVYNRVEVFSLTASNLINYLTNLSPTGFTDITGGNFSSNNAGDEIAGLKNNNSISFLKLGTGGLSGLVSMNGITPPETIRSISSGDFNNDGIDEVVAISYNQVFIYQILSGNLSLLTSFPAAGFDKVAVGNYEGTNTPEIALLSATGIIKIYNSTGNFLYYVQAPTGWYTGMVAGDYEGDGISEMMVYNNTDATFRVFKVRNGVLSYNAGDEEVFPKNQLQGVMCSCRLNNIPGKEALATFRNYDGQINIFTMDGQCPNLYLNDQTINSASYIGGTANNYPMDYHVNNTLYAGNYIIESGSRVDFTAGNKIVLKQGFKAKPGSKFHAYISPGLACSNNGNFRSNNTNQPSTAYTEQVTIQKIKDYQNSTVDEMPISIFPNPGNGSYALRTGYEGSYTVNVFNMIGSIVKEFKVTGKENQLNIVELNPGVYTFSIKQEGGKMQNIKVIKQ